MAKHLVITGVGRDRVGIVSRVAEVLYEFGCNLLDSSMTLLRGEFALILMVTLPENHNPQKLQERIDGLQRELGMSFHMRELSDEELKESSADGNVHMISVYGADKPGIVLGITRELAELKINITDVQTKYAGSSANPVFMMILEVDAPANLSTAQLDRSLRERAVRLGVDITVQSLEVLEL